MATKAEAKKVLDRLQIETPSWAYGNSGTRFKVFGQPGVPRDPFEKVEDAAQVHKYTGAAHSVALHIPWDKSRITPPLPSTLKISAWFLERLTQIPSKMMITN